MDFIRFFRITILFLSLLFQTHDVQAIDRSDITNTMFVHEKFFATYVVREDGSYDQKVEQVYRINEKNAIQALAQQSVRYSTSREKISILQAYTLKPDGRKLIVAADKIREHAEYTAPGSSSFSDNYIKTIIFPDLEVGDKTFLLYLVKCITPLYPKNFQDTTVGEFNLVDEITMVYDLPEKMPLFADQRGFKLVSSATSHGRTVYQWSYIPEKNYRIAADSVAYVDYGRRLYVSTFSNYKSLAEAYNKRAEENLNLTPELILLTKEITHGISDTDGKIDAIFSWVQKNIRYIAILIDVGGVVPHSSSEILANRYGDCKDQVALMEAMLKIVNVDSTPALISLGSSYRLPAVGAPFNHIILYVPEVNRYLDTTAAFVSARYLPESDYGKPVLLTKSGKIAYTPVTQTGTIKNLTIFKIKSDGSAAVAQTHSVSGSKAAPDRYTFLNSSIDTRKRRVEGYFAAMGITGFGTIESKMTATDNDAFETDIIGYTGQLANLPGPFGVRMRSSLSGEFNSMLAEITKEPIHIQDFLCREQKIEETARYDIATDIEIVAIPRNISLHDKFFDYDAIYEKKGNSVSVKRNYHFHHDNLVCTPDEENVFSSSLNKIVRDSQTQIILRSSAE